MVVSAALILRRTGEPQAEGASTTTLATTTTAPPGESSTTTLASGGIEIPDGSTVCDLYGTLTVSGTITDPDLVEASGLAVSRTTGGILWSHNDSRGGPELHAFDTSGADLGSFTVPGAFAFDWEDLAAGPGPDGTGAYLYVADIGDNFSIRDGSVALHRVPDIDPASMSDGAFPTSTPLPFQYPEGSPNAEAVFIDPVDPSVYFVTKDADLTVVYRGSLEPSETAAVLTQVAILSLDAEVSGGDISADGSVIALRGYREVWMWHRAPGESVADAFTKQPCLATSPDEPQGEAIAFDADYSYFTVSEENFPALYRIPFDG